MDRPQARIAAIQFGFALGVIAILARAAQLQIMQGGRWAQQAERQRTERAILPARRGALFDRNGCRSLSARSSTTWGWHRTSWLMHEPSSC